MFSDNCVSYGYDQKYGDLKTLANIYSASDCQLQCQLVVGCNVFTYNYNDYLCFLKSDYYYTLGDGFLHKIGPKFCSDQPSKLFLSTF